MERAKDLPKKNAALKTGDVCICLSLPNGIDLYPSLNQGKASEFGVAVIQRGEVTHFDTRNFSLPAPGYRNNSGFSAAFVKEATKFDWVRALRAHSQEQIRKDILAIYPKAIPAKSDNVEIGDVLCNHVKVDCLVVTEEMLNQGFSDFSFFYIVGKTRSNYVLKGRTQ